MMHNGADTIFHNVNFVGHLGKGLYIGGNPPGFSVALAHVTKYSGNLGQCRLYNCEFEANLGVGFHNQIQDTQIFGGFSAFNKQGGYLCDSDNAQVQIGTAQFYGIHPYLNEQFGIKAGDETNASSVASIMICASELEGAVGNAVIFGLGAGGSSIVGGRIYYTPVGVTILCNNVSISSEVFKCGIGYNIGSASVTVANYDIKGRIDVYPSDGNGTPHSLPQYGVANNNANNAGKFDLTIITQDEENNYKTFSGTELFVKNTGYIKSFCGQTGKLYRSGYNADKGFGTITSGNTITINSVKSGSITTPTLTTAAQGYAFITLNSDQILSNSVVVAQLGNYSGTLGTNGEPMLQQVSSAAGVASFLIKNNHSTNALNGSLQIKYEVN